jgi:hypothetical protein
MGKGKTRSKIVPGGAFQPSSDKARPVPGSRRPRRASLPDQHVGNLVIVFGKLDLGSQWCLTKINADNHMSLLQRIGSLETMTVHEAFSGGDPGKDYELARVPNKAARERLIQLNYDDYDQISRLRISGVGRLYGFRKGDRFYALWWDPNHEIWPSNKN